MMSSSAGRSHLLKCLECHRRPFPRRSALVTSSFVQLEYQHLCAGIHSAVDSDRGRGSPYAEAPRKQTHIYTYICRCDCFSACMYFMYAQSPSLFMLTCFEIMAVPRARCNLNMGSYVYKHVLETLLLGGSVMPLTINIGPLRFKQVRQVTSACLMGLVSFFKVILHHCPQCVVQHTQFVSIMQVVVS